ncbi:hypothetical protein D0817_05185 [Flavobacterium cupreum]|uniref:Uncharacterized protein n=1 Tax=Flavobacterium cupreum TaxID=2133766 RepID=A0A434AAB3_9FLAO|nr:hypothetical protein [Flavobacterium cupreum]RUT71276.1 hypothetical protein D0817_05185 [Flavobacterium cupreum]
MKIYILIIVVLLLSCNKQKINSQKTYSSSNYEKYYNKKIEAKKLADSALKTGNKILYVEAFKKYVSINCYEDFLYYSIKMSEKYDFGEAYFDTFYLLTLRENDSAIRVNKLANYYLFKAYEKKNINAEYEIEHIYPNLKSIPKPSYYLIKNE